MRPRLDEYGGIVLANTHIEHEAAVDNRLSMNPGSVSQPRDGDNRAAYAALDTDRGYVDFHRVRYNINRFISEVDRTGLLKETGARPLNGM